MTERFVSLNSAERPVVTIEVGDRRFAIRRVVTGVRQLWGAFVSEYMSYIERVQEYDRKVEKLRTGGRADAIDEIRKLTEEIETAVDGFASRKIDAQLAIVRLLLEKNGYEYDRQWWLENAEEGDYKDFIVTALEKDVPPVKKKTAEPSTGEG